MPSTDIANVDHQPCQLHFVPNRPDSQTLRPHQSPSPQAESQRSARNPVGQHCFSTTYRISKPISQCVTRTSCWWSSRTGGVKHSWVLVCGLGLISRLYMRLGCVGALVDAFDPPHCAVTDIFVGQCIAHWRARFSPLQIFGLLSSKSNSFLIAPISLSNDSLGEFI